ncbi:hypothetical protein OAS39_12625 [Pirellulales bacterium]|nr:hypothetical protein [Pirellulales bacterium]
MTKVRSLAGRTPFGWAVTTAILFACSVAFGRITTSKDAHSVGTDRQDVSFRSSRAAQVPGVLTRAQQHRPGLSDLPPVRSLAALSIPASDARQVHGRFACPKYLRQTFHEFADSARMYYPWSKARYRLLRDRGMKHNAAVRKLGKCASTIYRCHD